MPLCRCCCCLASPVTPCQECSSKVIYEGRTHFMPLLRRESELFRQQQPYYDGPAAYTGKMVNPRPKTVNDLVGLPPGAEISLDSLNDPKPGQRPDYTLPMLAKLAILGSPRQQLSLAEIYEAIERRFPWYADPDNPKSWKTSLRHTLSLVAAFQKKRRVITDPGKGSYWYVDFSKGEGNKRPRKRGRKSKKETQREEAASRAALHADEELDELSGSDSNDNIDPTLKVIPSEVVPVIVPVPSRNTCRPSDAFPVRTYVPSKPLSKVPKPRPKVSKPPQTAPYPMPTLGRPIRPRLVPSQRGDELLGGEHSFTFTGELNLPPLHAFNVHHGMRQDDELVSSEASTPSARELSLPPLHMLPLRRVDKW